MNFYVLTFLVLLLSIVNVQNLQYAILTEDDKEFLLKQLPINHKLSIPMQQFINQSYFPLPDERSNGQVMLYQPELYALAPAPPRHQMNLPVIHTQSNPPSYVLIAPPIGPRPDFPYVLQNQVRASYPQPQWPKHIWAGIHVDSATPNTNWEELANNAVVEEGNLNKGMQIPSNILVNPKILETFDMTLQRSTTPGTTDPQLESTSIILRQVVVEILTSPPLTSKAIAQTSPETSSNIDMPGPTISINTLPQTSSPQSSQTHAMLDEPQPELTTTRNSPIVTTPNLDSINLDIAALLAPSRNVYLPSYNKSECDAMKVANWDMGTGGLEIGASKGPMPASTTVSTTLMNAKKDSQINEKLMNILKSVESIKPNEIASPSPNEGLPCSISGKWISTLAGSGFSIEQTSGYNFNVPLIPANTDGFLKSDGWKITASIPIKDGNLFVLTATRSTDYNMATFTGECRTCNSEQVITGHWLIVKPALTCEEMNRGQDFFGDTWKRNKVQDSTSSCNVDNVMNHALAP